MKRVPVTVSLRPEGKEILTALAAEMDLSRSAFIRLMLNEALEARGITRKTITLLRKVA